MNYGRCVWHLIGQLLPENGSSQKVLGCPFSYFYFNPRPNYLAGKWDFTLRLHLHSTLYLRYCIVSRCLLLHFASSKPARGISCWSPESKGPQLLCVPTTPVFAYYSGYILTHSFRQDLIRHLATSRFVVHSFITFLGLSNDGTKASLSANICVLSM